MIQNFYKSIDFTKFTSIKIGPIKEVLVINEVGNYSDYFILGAGNNILVSQKTLSFAILGKTFEYIEQKDDLLYVGCATKSGKLLSYAKRNNLADFEFLGKLPGTLGGLVKMNAGLKEYEIFNYIHSIKTKDGYIKAKDINYSYRHTDIKDIVYEVVFYTKQGFSKEKQDLFKKMRENQPQMPSAGSCFKNPLNDSAGRLIEAVGLKGYSKGEMSFSSEHANFLVNNGNGSYEDAIYLIQLAQEKVYKEFGISLENEIIIL